MSKRLMTVVKKIEPDSVVGTCQEYNNSNPNP